ncbi:MAG: tryptophan synthase subunit alpha [Candidatus Cyclobacteriaceae bacterium M3_2C_046]
MSATVTENRIEQVFKKKKANILSVYFTAGFPRLDDTVPIMNHLQEGGADMIEIGIPFSDPMADGPTIQESNQAALANGMTLNKLFEQLQQVRASLDIPIILMGYFNPVLQYGLEKFGRKCEECGVDGLIIPDLPMQDYLDLYKAQFDQFGLYNIFLITPQTSPERIRLIDENSHGFIYMVSSASITGAKSGITPDQIRYFERVRDMQLKNPTLIGFGISNRETFNTASQYAAGAIIGSAFIKVLQKSTNLKNDIIEYIKAVKVL